MDNTEQIGRTPQLSLSPYWDAVDGIVCINLDKRKDRWESFCKAAKGVIPEGKIHRISGVEGVKMPGYGQLPWFSERTAERSRYWGGAAGCMMAHTNAIRMAQQNGWRNVMILEDDISANVTPEGLCMVNHALTNLSGRYLLYLGYAKRVPRGVRVKQVDDVTLWRIDGALTTHAYVIPQSMFQPLLNILPAQLEDAWAWMARHRAIDTFYRNEVAAWSGVRIYSILPLMFHQNGMRSDLVNIKISLPEKEDPRALGCLTWAVYHRLLMLFRRMKTCLDTRRTYRRALNGGFPGYRGKKKNSIWARLFHWK